MGVLNSVLKIFLGDKSKKDFKSVQPILHSIKKAESELSQLKIDELRSQTSLFKQMIQDQLGDLVKESEEIKANLNQTKEIYLREKLYKKIDDIDASITKVNEHTLNEILPKAFALIKATAQYFKDNTEIAVQATENDRRLAISKPYVTIEDDKAIWKNSWNAAGKEVIWDMVHYDVQLIGGIALHQGKISEMQTGEGKTLVATLPLFLNALSGFGVHLVTVNDYLAKRDCAWMAPIFEFHGLSVDCIDLYPPNSKERKEAYACDIVYGTNNEFGFDYLRDNMATSPTELVQRKHNYVIVDEVDSVLVDDARTPLIISGPVEQGDRHEFDALKPKIAELEALQRNYLGGVLVEAKKLIEQGNTKEGGFLLYRVFRGLPKNKALIKFLSKEGIRQLLQKTENHHLQDNNREMPKIDAELYFTIDEKNNQTELTEKGVATLSKGKDADFFLLPDIGIEVAKIDAQNMDVKQKAELKESLFKDFDIKSERIHTVNQLLKAYTLFEKDLEYVVVDNKVKIVDEQTGRIMEGRRYSDGLHQAIEAKENVRIEAATQTFATITLQNYFRMYEKLSGMTGTAITEAGEFWEIYKLDVMEIPTNRPIARQDRNDLIYKTKREKFNAIIGEVQSLTKQNRPILIGTTSVEVSELLSKMLSIRKIKHNVLNAKRHKQEAEIVAQAGHAGVVTIATNMAGRGTDIKIDNQVNEAGGLAIIGTERHDSRRVDRQLRGRSGRQGNRGSSQFYVSLEDNLMRIFGSERIAKIMDRMGLKEGEVIQHSLMTRSIERAQKKVEENNFGIRKRLLEYDNVMNSQREVIYGKRRHALDGKRLKIDISNMIYDTSESIVEINKDANDDKNFEFEIIKNFSIASPFSEKEFAEYSKDELTTRLYNFVYNYYTEKMAENATVVYPVIKNVYEDPTNNYERIVVPFSDGVKTLNVVTDLVKAYETNGEELINDFEKNISLAIIDDLWKNHLRKMDELKQSVQLAVHEQKDPLLIYKFESFELFKSLTESINRDIVSFLFKGKLPSQSSEKIQDAKILKRPGRKLNLTKEDVLNTGEMSEARRNSGQRNRQPVVIETVVREQPKIGRNEKVIIKNTNSGTKKTLKFKQAEPLIQNGEWVIVKE